MPQPMPPPQPAKGIGLIGWLIFLAIGVAVLGYSLGWFELKKDPVTSKTQVVTHMEKFKADKDAFLKTSGEYLNKGKDKLAGLLKKKEEKPADKATIEKENAEVQAQLDKLKASLKSAEDAADEASLNKAKEGLNDSIKKLLDK